MEAKALLVHSSHQGVCAFILLSGGSSIGHGTNIVTLPLGNGKQIGETKQFLKLKVAYLLDSQNHQSKKSIKIGGEK